MVASLLDSRSKVAITIEDKGTHIVDLNHLAESDLRKLKIAALQNLHNVNAVRDQTCEFIRRINKVLDTRANNAACLG